MMTKIGLLCFLFMMVMTFGQHGKTGGEQRRLSHEGEEDSAKWLDEEEIQEKKAKEDKDFGKNKDAADHAGSALCVIVMEVTTSGSVRMSAANSLLGDHQSEEVVPCDFDKGCSERMEHFTKIFKSSHEHEGHVFQVGVVPWSDKQESEKFLHEKSPVELTAIKTAAAWTLLASAMHTGIVISLESDRTRLMPVVHGESETRLTVEIPVGGGAIAACLCNAKNTTVEFCTSGIDRWVEAIKWSLYEVDAVVWDHPVPPLIGEALLQNVFMPVPDLPFWYRCDAVPQAFQSALSKNLSYVTILQGSDLFSRVWTAVELSSNFCNALGGGCGGGGAH